MNTAALITLWNLTQRHHGTSGARAAAGVLLGLYNGTRFPFDLTDLRVLDHRHYEAALEVIRGDSPCVREVHAWLNALTGRQDFGQRFEHLAHDWRRKGKCKRDGLVELSPRSLLIAEAAAPAGASYGRGPAKLPTGPKVLEFCDTPIEGGGQCSLGRGHEGPCRDEDQ